MSTNSSRRHFLRFSAGLATAAGLPRISTPLATSLAGLGALAAQSSGAANLSSPYKAVVCLFMSGGNDSHNWVVPTDATGYAEYAAARRELAWPAASLLPIATTGQASGRTFGMPLELQPLRKWYESGQAAIVSNVGPLVRPITRAEYQAGTALPSKLFSHNDQASTWQSLAPEGASSGWGGRMGDILMAANAYPVFTAVSAASNAVFLSGDSVTQYQVGLEGPVAVPSLSNTSIFGSSAAPAVLQRTLASAGGTALQSEYTRVVKRGIDTSAVMQTALSAVSVPAIPATPIVMGTGNSMTLNNEGLARQLRVVAQMAGAGQALGMQRQVFMVSIGGFDSHANQMRDQPSLMSRVALSVDYFLSALSDMGLLNNVTLFTASDFGRTLLTNGSGSDHGWAVTTSWPVGQCVVDRSTGASSTALGGADDIGSGRLLPAYSVSQMAAPLGRWLGLSASEVAGVLPGLSNFDANALPFV